MVRNERTDLGDASSEITNQYLEEFRAVFDRMSANGGNLTRRDFMKLSAAGALGLFLSACKAGTLTPTPEQPKTSVSPTNEPRVPTPTVVSTNKESPKATPTNEPVVAVEGYPARLADLATVVESIPPADFLKKYPELKKEYDILTGRLLKSMGDLGFKDNAVTFKINEHSWKGADGKDKFSWIVNVFVGKDLYIPRDFNSGVRPLDLSAYGLKEFTMEKLEIPKGSDPLKLRFARSRLGYLVAVIVNDAGDPTLMYNMRRETGAVCWQNEKGEPIDRGVLLEKVGLNGLPYTEKELTILREYQSRIQSALKEGRVYRERRTVTSAKTTKFSENALCEVIQAESAYLMIGLRRCLTKSGVIKEVPTAIDMYDGGYLSLSSDIGVQETFISVPYVENMYLIDDDVVETPEVVWRAIGQQETKNRRQLVSYVNEKGEKKYIFTMRQSVRTLGNFDFSFAKVLYSLSPRDLRVKYLVWGDTPEKTTVEDSDIDKWIDYLLEKDKQTSEYVRIAFKGVSKEWFVEDRMRTVLGLLKKIKIPEIRAKVIGDIRGLRFDAGNGGIGMGKDGTLVDTGSIRNRLGNPNADNESAGLFFHEMTHLNQKNVFAINMSDPREWDAEFYTNLIECVNLQIFSEVGYSPSRLNTVVRPLLQTGRYSRDGVPLG